MKIENSESTTYACGHEVVTGGNFADPTAQVSEAAGMKTFKTSPDACDMYLEGKPC